MKYIVIAFIDFYRVLISPLLGPSKCRFYPTCSQYFKEAVSKYGAVKGSVLCAKAFSKLGFEVCPKFDQKRSDIIEAIRLGTPERVISFCEGVQAAAPIDSHVSPIPWDMPGYEDQVIMAAGAFVQGSSIELSADAPMREPYNVYFQGGLTYEHSKFGVLNALQYLRKAKII